MPASITQVSEPPCIDDRSAEIVSTLHCARFGGEVKLKECHEDEVISASDQVIPLTGAGGVGLVLVVATVVGPVAQPALGDAAVVAAFELISRAAVVVYKK